MADYEESAGPPLLLTEVLVSSNRALLKVQLNNLGYRGDVGGDSEGWVKVQETSQRLGKAESHHISLQ